jgi:DNA-binding NarL/FixJ family response regulator
MTLNSIQPPIQILIAERAITVAEALASSLRQAGYAIVNIVHSGEQAIAAALAHQPDVVLMDIGLPGAINSLSAADQIASAVGCRVVFMAAYLDQHTTPAAQVRVRSHRCIFKPFAMAELNTVLHQVLKRDCCEPVCAEPASEVTIPELNPTQDLPHLLSLARSLSSPPPADKILKRPQSHSFRLADQALLKLFTAASRIHPMPEIAIVANQIAIYVGSLEAADQISEFCAQFPLPYPHQLFYWSWQQARYQSYFDP